MECTPHARRRATILVALHILAGCAVLAFSAPAAPLDDTYIHLVFGRSLVRGGFMQFNPGVPTTGLTSPLWILPSAAASLAGGSAPVVLMLISALAGALTIPAGGEAALLLLLCGPLLFHSTSGMETALAALLATLITAGLASGRLRGRSLGILLAAACLTRPESAVLCIPAAMKAEGRKEAARRVIPPALALALWAAWNLHASGSILPSTFHAKAARPFYGDLPHLTVRLFFSAPLALTAAIPGTIGMARRRDPAWLCVPLLAAAAVLTAPNQYNQLRYHVPWLCASMLAAASWLRGRGLSLRRAPARSTALAAAAVLMVPGAAFFIRQRVRAASDVWSIDVRPSILVDSLAEEGDVVAACDIGATAWITELEVIDLDGLVTPERLPGRGRAGWGWIAERSDWLIAFPGQYSGLVREADGDLTPVAGFASAHPVVCGEDTVSVWRVSRSSPPGATGSASL